MNKFIENKEKYSTGATRNPIAPVREKGLPRSSTINHMFEHWHKYLEGDRSEPHLAKMAFGLMALWHYERKGIDVKR